MSPSPRLRPASAFLSPAAVFVACLLTAPWARGELPWTKLDALFPAGARVGATTEVRLNSGAELDVVDTLRFSHPGIVGRRVPGGSKGDHVFAVSVAGDVPPGAYDVSALGEFGLSNPRTICIGWRKEIVEVEPNETHVEAMAVELGSVLNGRLGKPTDVDAFRFHVGPGRKVIADCRAVRIDSPLAPVLEIVDEAGRRVAYARSGRDDDALLVFDPPREGDYTLRISDQTYRSGEEFVYRIELHNDPQVLAVEPVSGRAGTTAPFTVLGFNLPGGRNSEQRWGRWSLDQLETSIALPGEATSYDRNSRVTPVEAGMDSFSWRLVGDSGVSNAVRLHVAGSASTIDAEPNNRLDQAQEVVLPADVSGRFATAGDVDVFRFDVTKGNAVWIEVFAERLGSKVDPALVVDFVPQGQSDSVTRVAAVDDTAANLLPVGFETQSDDPSFLFDPPADGRCVITVRDQYGQTRGDATLTYRLVVRRPQPDFRLVAVPTLKGIGMRAPVSLRRGDSFEMTLLAFRQDGFQGAIEVPSTDLGGGLFCDGTVIPAKQNSAPLVLRSRDDALLEPREISLIGRAAIVSADGSSQSLERPVRPATTIRNTTKVQTRSVPAPARLAREFVFSALSEAAPLELRHDLERQAVAQGRMVLVPLRLVRREGATGPVTVTLQGLAKTANIDSGDITFAAGETEKQARLFVRADAPPQSVVLTWTAKSKVQYRRQAERAAQAQLALDGVTKRLQAAVVDAAGATTEAAASALVQQLEAERDAAQKLFKELEQAAQPKELEFDAMTSPLVLDVQAAPVILSLPSAQAVAVSVGQSQTVAVKLNRQNGFEGPVEISLFTPNSPVGLTAAVVAVAAGAVETEIVIQASADTPAGDVPNAVVRANCGGVFVDAPISLKVQP